LFTHFVRPANIAAERRGSTVTESASFGAGRGAMLQSGLVVALPGFAL
jgi:hypothetical protein